MLKKIILNIRYLFFFVVIGTTTDLLSQSFEYVMYTTLDGLPSDEIYYIMQDRKGYMWFATDNGVSKYDGYSFKNYSVKDGLLDNLIFSIYEDFKGRLWFISHAHKLCYLEKDSIHAYENLEMIKENLPKTTRIINNSFHVDSSGTLHMGTYGMGEYEVFEDGNIIRKRTTGHIEIKDKPFLLTSTNPKLEEKKFISYKGVTKKINSRFYPFRVYGAQTKEGSVLLSTEKDVVEMNKYGEVSVFEFDNLIWMGVTSDNSIWLSFANKGVRRYSGSINNPVGNPMFENKSVTNVYIDNADNFWISTFTGLYFIPSYDLGKVPDAKMTNNSVRCLVKGKDSEVWFTTYNNEFFNLNNKKLIKYHLDRDVFISTIFFSEIDNKLYYGGWNFFGVLQDNELKEIKLLARDKDNIKHNVFHIHDLYQKSKKEFIYSGIRVGSIDLNSKSIFRKSKIKVQGVTSDECKNFLYTDSLLYICAEFGGLWSYKSSVFTQIKPLDDRFNCNFVDITKDSENNIWLASKGNGVLCLIKDSVIQISEDDGLSSNSVNTLWVDSNVVWAGTMNGLNKVIIKDFDQRVFKIENIYKNHGLASNVINDIVLNNDTLYVGTDRGLSFFNISNFTLNQKAPPIYISNISIEEKDTLVQDAYKLDYNQNNIAISYVGINYRTGNKTWYKYRLVGADKNWVETQNRIVRYSSLQPGEYRFEVVAQNENGIWGTDPAQISITIARPYWQTWWFMAFVFLFVAGIAVLVILIIFRVKIKESKKRNLLHNNLNKLKQEALAQQMNPHFIFNTLSSIQYYINENEKSASNKYLTMFSNLMRMTLNNSHKKNITIREEIEALEIYIQLEQLRFEDKFDYKIDIDPQLDIEKILIPSLMLQPFVENAIWHGIMHKDTNDGLVEVAISQDKDLIKFVIQDNGVGRKKSSEINAQRSKTHKSLGSKITESRLRLISTLYGGALSIKYIDLQDINEDNCGTQVTISLPILAAVIRE